MSRIYRDLGTVAMDLKGDYDPTAYYEKLNVVNYNDSTYMAKEPVHGENPSTSSKWQLIGGGLTREDIAHKAYFFDTVASMKAANLVNGDYVITEGYYSANDGGGAEYKIVSTESVSDYQEELDNGLYATLIINDILNVKQIGAYGDNSHNDTIAIQTALDLGYDLYFNKGTYLINQPLIFKGQNNIVFDKKAKIITNTVINNIFEFNDIQNSPISQNCSIKNMHLDGNDKSICGMTLSNYVNLYFENLQIDNCTAIGLKTKGTNSRQQAELRITKSCIRNYNYGYADSVGIQIDSTDGTYCNMSIADFETAFKINASGNEFVNTHPWIHFKELWNKSTAFILPAIGGDVTNITGGFIDTIRTAYKCDTGMLNVSNSMIYYAETLYGDKTDEDNTATIADLISSYPINIFVGTVSTILRISNINVYAPSGTSNVIANFDNPDNSISNCIFAPESAWTSSLIDYTRTITKTVSDSSNVTSSFKTCCKTGRLVTFQYKASLDTNFNAWTTIATLPFKPLTEVFFQDYEGHKLYITTTGLLQGAQNLTAGDNLRFTITFLGNLHLD